MNKSPAKSPLRISSQSSLELLLKQYTNKVYKIYENLIADKAVNLCIKFQEEILANQIKSAFEYRDKIKEMEFKAMNSGNLNF